MQREIAGVQAAANLRDFAESVATRRHAVFAVYSGSRAVGMIAMWELSKVPPEKWSTTTVGEIADRHVPRVPPDCEVMEALRMLSREEGEHLLVVDTDDGAIEGVVTKTDILRALQARGIARMRDRVA